MGVTDHIPQSVTTSAGIAIMIFTLTHALHTALEVVRGDWYRRPILDVAESINGSGG